MLLSINLKSLSSSDDIQELCKELYNLIQHQEDLDQLRLYIEGTSCSAPGYWELQSLLKDKQKHLWYKTVELHSLESQEDLNLLSEFMATIQKTDRHQYWDEDLFWEIYDYKTQKQYQNWLQSLPPKEQQTEREEETVYNLEKEIAEIFKKKMSIFKVESEHHSYYELNKLHFEKLSQLHFLKLTQNEKLQEEIEMKKRQQAPRRGEGRYQTPKYNSRNQKRAYSKQRSSTCN
jgi:hypothetical protein